MKKVICLVSGGMDSISALYSCIGEYNVVCALSFNYGSKHNEKEIVFAKKHCDKLSIPHRIIDLKFVNELFVSDLLKSGGSIPEGHYEDGSMKRTVVPFRNGIMLAIACGYAESLDCDYVVIGAHRGDHAIYPDCRREFIDAMSNSLFLGTYKNVEILSPFIDKTKTDIAKIGSRLGVDFSQTWSCYKGKEKHCGKCGTCVERIEAFQKAGLNDPTEYEN